MSDLPAVANNIELLARGILAQLGPLTGHRGTGTGTATATGADVVVKKNTYLLPVLGRVRDNMPFKVGANPATEDGSWTITSAGVSIAILSNLGGANQNLPSGTVLRWEPPIEGLEPTVTADALFVDGEKGIVGEAHFFEDLDASQKGLDTVSAQLSHFPAMMLTWEGSLPAEGQTTGLGQAGTRLKRGQRAFRETFSLYIIGGRESGDPARRRGLMSVMETCTSLLTDIKCNEDGETLSALGSLEILGRSPFDRSATSYIYQLQFRVVRTVSKLERRTFSPWNLTRYHDVIPEDAPLTEVDRVDISVDMT